MARRTSIHLLLAVVSAAASAAPAAGQATAPTVRGLLTGYASVNYSAVPDDDLSNDFVATISPMLLHRVGENILFEGEMDLELEEGATSLHLEHAEVHYVGLERVTLTAGMFHVPFSVWHHATWVNRMPTPPLLYQDTHGGPPHDGLLPILFDVGLMARANVPLIDGWTTSVAAWVSQGPSDEIPEHAHGEEEEDPNAPEPVVSALGYGANFEDNNSDKMVGLQLRAVGPGGVTVQASGFRAAYDEAGDLGVYGANLSLIFRPGSHQSPLFDLRGEGVLLGQEYDDAGSVETVNYGGYYVQLSRRLEGFEPIVRWSQLPQSVAAGDIVVEARRQLALGVNYWLAPSVPLKAAYNVELDGADTIFLEWSVGF